MIENEWPTTMFIMDIDGKNVKKLSPSPLYKGNVKVEDYLLDMEPNWSPDGKTIVFSSNRHTLNESYDDVEIYTINLETYEIKQLTKAYNFSQKPCYSPDGSKITFMSNRNNYWHIYIIDSDGKNVKKITSGSSSNRFPSWSNDGKYIVFHSDRDGNLELYLYNVAEETTTRFTTDPSTNGTASFSSDSKWILYHSDTSGNTDLFIKNIETNEVIPRLLILQQMKMLQIGKNNSELVNNV